MPIFLNGLPCVRPGMPESSTKTSTGRLRGSEAGITGSVFSEFGVHDQDVGAGPVGDECLLPVEDVVLTVALDVGFHAAERVRARVRLGDGRCGAFPTSSARRTRFLLGQRPAAHDGRCTQPEADRRGAQHSDGLTLAISDTSTAAIDPGAARPNLRLISSLHSFVGSSSARHSFVSWVYSPACLARSRSSIFLTDSAAITSRPNWLKIFRAIG